MDRLEIGVVVAGPKPHHLADAVRRHPDAASHEVALEDQSPHALAGCVVDVPLDERGQMVAEVAHRWDIPILIEMPVTDSFEQARELLDRVDGSQIFALNPLDYRIPTRRLLDDVTAPDDALESLFAVWRCKRSAASSSALPQLVDFVGHLVGAEPSRVSAMAREVSTVLLALIRYSNDVVAALEVGTHLPESLVASSELLIECFCRENAYQCQADAQAISIDGQERMWRDWSPQSAEGMVGAFIDMLRGESVLDRVANDDLNVLALCGALYASASGGNAQQMGRPVTHSPGVPQS